jgi:carbon-monoxide dehydrogenase medium subunit
MHAFELLEPRTLAEACAVLAAETDAKPIAGGTALLTIIKQGLQRPKCLVNLTKIRNGSAISFDPQNGLRIGGLATINEIEASPLVRAHCPVLAESCHLVANIRIRNMATIGGNLAHADYQSDPPTVLTALDALIELSCDRGIRQMSLREFQRGSYETAIETGELITAVLIPPMPLELKGVYIKFTTGSSGERPCAGVAALARMENGACRELRLAVGAVSQRPVRIAAGEDMARARALSKELIESIAAEAARQVDPIEDVHGPVDYKRHLVQVLARRAVFAVTFGFAEAAQ